MLGISVLLDCSPTTWLGLLYENKSKMRDLTQVVVTAPQSALVATIIVRRAHR